MTIINCPKCGSVNITTAGVCANCGWSQFAQVTTVSTRITDEIEIMLSGRALLDDYKRLLLENRNLNARIAELSQAVGLITTLKPTMVMDTEHPLDMAKEVAEYVTARIAELEEALSWKPKMNGFPRMESDERW